MRIVFMGSPDFAVPSLVKLAHSDHKVVSVVSNPDKRRGRGSSKQPTPVKKTAQELQLPVIDAIDLKSVRFQEQIKESDPDLLVVVAFRILPNEILDIPRIGSVNLHASLLPKYRGAAPIHHAIMNGETETGCTVFFIEEKIDTGLIIDQKKTKIGPDETTGDLYERLKHIGSDLLLQSIHKIETGVYKRVKQDHSRATTAPRLYKKDAKIDFGQSSYIIHNKIRGLSPFPTAWCYYNGEKLNIYRSKIGPDIKLQQGELTVLGKKLLAGCKNGTVELAEVQLPGTKRISGPEFANGYELKQLT